MAACLFARFFSLLVFVSMMSLFHQMVDAGDINDIQHIVIFMQENRPFDQYYGLLRGVRGFDDRAAQLLPSGRPVWYQPTSVTNSSAYLLPFRVDTNRTSATCMDAPEMDYPTDIGIWNYGRLDAWNTARVPGFGMSYFNRSDLPYYYALADGFTIGDQYHQSTFTQTNPNRLHLFSGCNGLSMGYPPVLDNTEPRPGFEWITVGEVLEAANISWRVYQEVDNFDDNGFAWFKNFQEALPGSPLFDKGIMPVVDIVEAFGADLASGKLPQVSYIIAPTALSEHATNHPAAGEDLSARLIAQLKANPAVYANTAFILDYDEGGQFFDHHWVPTPPINASEGLSTVMVHNEINNYTQPGLDLPIGLGFRVPLMVISPWTRGGFVNSEVFDHTSVLRFVEARFGVRFDNISPWRRAITGDLTSCFDFDSADYTWPELPDTSDYANMSNYQCNNLPPPTIPDEQFMPTQEPGVRPARTLPYQFQIDDQLVSATNLSISMSSLGTSGAAFIVYDLANLTVVPKKYTVGAGLSLTDFFPIGSSGAYDFALHGPNGFVRRLSGSSLSILGCTAASSYDISGGHFVLTLTNSAAASNCVFDIVDNAYNTTAPLTITVTPQQKTASQGISVASSGNWYDVSVSVSASYSRRYMGRIERAGGTSDPATANPLHPYTVDRHPLISEAMAQADHKQTPRMQFVSHKDAISCFGSPIDACDAEFVQKIGQP